VDRRPRDREPIVAAKQRLTGALGMRHQPQHVASGVGDPSDVAQRAIRIRLRGDPAVGGAVPEDDLAVSLEGFEGVRVGEEIAFAVRDWDSEDLARSTIDRESTITLLDPQLHPLAAKLARRVSQQRSRQQTRLLKDLKAIADAEHEAAAVREVRDRIHHRGEARDGATAKVVAVGEAAGKDDEVEVTEVPLAIVDKANRFTQDLEERVGTIPVTPGAGKHHDTGLQEGPPPRNSASAGSGWSSMRKSSITSLASSWRAISSTRLRACSSSASSSRIDRYLPARTSFTDSNPRACRPPRMVRPAGSLTTGFSVTKTSARYMTPQTLASLSARLAWTGRPEAPERLEVADARSLNDLIR